MARSSCAERGVKSSFHQQKKGKRDAVLWEEAEKERILRQLAANLTTTPSDSLTLLEWANEYLKYVQNRFVKTTFVGKRYAFKLLIDCLGANRRVEDISVADGLAFLTLQNEKRSGNAANIDRKKPFRRLGLGVQIHSYFPKGAKSIPCSGKISGNTF